MKFINPKVDYAFEKILISFLNAIIYDGENIIESLTIVNPFNPDQIISFKPTFRTSYCITRGYKRISI